MNSCVILNFSLQFIDDAYCDSSKLPDESNLPSLGSVVDPSESSAGADCGPVSGIFIEDPYVHPDQVTTAEEEFREKENEEMMEKDLDGKEETAKPVADEVKAASDDIKGDSEGANK